MQRLGEEHSQMPEHRVSGRHPSDISEQPHDPGRLPGLSKPIFTSRSGRNNARKNIVRIKLNDTTIPVIFVIVICCII